MGCFFLSVLLVLLDDLYLNAIISLFSKITGVGPCKEFSVFILYRGFESRPGLDLVLQIPGLGLTIMALT